MWCKHYDALYWKAQSNRLSDINYETDDNAFVPNANDILVDEIEILNEVANNVVSVSNPETHDCCVLFLGMLFGR